MSFVKYRLKEVATDFGTTPKAVADIISRYYEKPKSNTQVLTDLELNAVFEYMTQHNQIDSIEQVFAVKPAPKAEAPKQEAPKPAAAPQQPRQDRPQQGQRPQGQGQQPRQDRPQGQFQGRPQQGQQFNNNRPQQPQQQPKAEAPKAQEPERKRK